jgi:tetratricopeptide (TPR) repeat protein
VLFLDADDLIPPHKLATQGAYLDAHPEYGLTYGAWQHIDAGGRQVLREVRPRRSGAVLHALLRREFFPAVGAVLVRRSCFDYVGNFDPALRAAEDMDMWLRIAAAGYRFGYQDEVLFYYRDTLGSMSTRLENQLHYELRRIDKFFASPDLPVGCANLRGIAVAAIYFEYAARYTGAGNIHAAKRCLEAALSIGPELAADDEWVIGWISGFLESCVGERDANYESAAEILDRLIGMLPGSEEKQQRLRRRAQGRMHADALFRAYDGWLESGAWRHILPALSCEPQLFANRGFWKVAFAAVVGATRPQPGSRLPV